MNWWKAVPSWARLWSAFDVDAARCPSARGLTEFGPQWTQAHSRAQAPIGVAGGIGEVAPGCNHHNDLLCKGLELGTKVTGALEREQLLLSGLNAEMTEGLLIEGLNALARDRNGDATDAQERHGAEVDLARAGPPPAGAHFARAQTGDAEGALEGRDTFWPRTTAKGNIDVRALA